jgi:hypothetical protein
MSHAVFSNLVLDTVEHAGECLVAGIAGQHGGQHMHLLVVRHSLCNRKSTVDKQTLNRTLKTSVQCFESRSVQQKMLIQRSKISRDLNKFFIF